MGPEAGYGRQFDTVVEPKSVCRLPADDGGCQTWLFLDFANLDDLFSELENGAFVQLAIFGRKFGVDDLPRVFPGFVAKMRDQPGAAGVIFPVIQMDGGAPFQHQLVGGGCYEVHVRIGFYVQEVSGLADAIILRKNLLRAGLEIVQAK